MGNRVAWLIDIVHYNEAAWKRPDGAMGLIRTGVPVEIALKWKKLHRDIHSGLRKRVKESQN